GRGEKEKKKKGNESIGASLDLAAMEYNFPPLHEQVLFKIKLGTETPGIEGSSFAFFYICVLRLTGIPGTGLTGSTLIYNVIATFTCKCTEGTAGKSNFTATPNVTMNTDIGSSVNLIDPHTSTAVSPTSPSKNGSANNNGGEQYSEDGVALLYAASLLKEELSHVPVWMKFHDVPLVAYTSDGNSFKALNAKNLDIEEVVTGNKATTSGTQEDRLKQLKKTTVDDDYDPYDDDVYEGNDISEYIKTICDDLDIKVCGR
ncbi:hypothetical protein Tco_1411473, partial [Tanacetum coccineum]